MNILMIHPHDIYSSYEPWTIRITSLAKEFSKKGHKVKLAYFPLPTKERGIITSNKITDYETIPLDRRKWSIIKNIDKIRRFGRWADIIHFQKCFTHASIPALLSAYANKKHVHYDWDDWEYGIYMWSPPSKVYGWYLDQIERIIPRCVDTISVASDELMEMAREYGFYGETIKVNVCADIERFHPGYDKQIMRKKYGINGKIVLYLGQLHGAQYVELYLKAAKIVTEVERDVKFLVVGDGSDIDRLKQIAANLKLQDKAIFAGAAIGKNVNLFLATADVAVACFADTKQVRCKSPLKIAEYMASGKAIVASNVGEVPWMTNGAAALSKPGNPKSLAKEILILLNDDKLRQ
ncbi:MAG: glycosyltransferase, partial [Candidatus Woesearchaeota archaeon]|nr:glycosyltransferase [Candidatus Woesearchaeota archaeon]